MKQFEEVRRPNSFKDLIDFDTCFVNDNYMVDVRFDKSGKGMKGFVWLSIKRKDKNWIRDWRELQTIKNLLCGAEREGCEIFPAESRLVDSSNQFHIFVLPEGEQFPFGYQGRLIVKGHKGGWEKGSSQRPFKENPKDAVSVEEVMKRAEELKAKRKEGKNESSINGKS